MELAYTGSFFEFHPPAIIGVEESSGRWRVKKSGWSGSIESKD